MAESDSHQHSECGKCQNALDSLTAAVSKFAPPGADGKISGAEFSDIVLSIKEIASHLPQSIVFVEQAFEFMEHQRPYAQRPFLLGLSMHPKASECAKSVYITLKAQQFVASVCNTLDEDLGLYSPKIIGTEWFPFIGKAKIPVQGELLNYLIRLEAATNEGKYLHPHHFLLAAEALHALALDAEDGVPANWHAHALKALKGMEANGEFMNCLKGCLLSGHTFCMDTFSDPDRRRGVSGSDRGDLLLKAVIARLEGAKISDSLHPSVNAPSTAFGGQASFPGHQSQPASPARRSPRLLS